MFQIIFAHVRLYLVRTLAWFALCIAFVVFVCWAPAYSQETTSDVPLDEGVSLQFPNNPVSDILGIYELLTGKTMVKDIDIFDLDQISLITASPVS